ncbi:SpoIIE family protein phosphatase [Streptomyces sp. NPDC058251]|uniref:ATP-binding SpoIIE family protein phosphatase n=1 Tax=Streptomyces sp. NPDC058251 TaxID=3346404 RepID=UPI0036E4DA0C
MDAAADGLVSRAARELSPSVDRLIADVERSLRRQVPELWEDPDIARMSSENIAEHISAALFGLERGIDPSRIEPPAAEMERARRLARHGTPISAMLRAQRLAQAIVLDRLFDVLPRLTSDVEQISAVARELIATATGYVDRTAEAGVMAFQEERDRRLQWRLSMVNETSMRVGATLDISRTAQELADLGTEHFADCVTVDLLDSVLRGHDALGEGPFVLRRLAQRSVGGAQQSVAPAQPSVEDDCPEWTIAPQQLHTYPDGTPAARALASGQPSRHRLDGTGRPSGSAPHPDPGRAFDGHRIHSTLVVPLRARGTTLGVAQFFRHRGSDLFDDEDLLLAQEIAARAAVAVDNARRYTHARATALTLQRSLLPRRLPEQSAVEVAWRYLPAGAQVGVGGDWYDVIPLSGARVALVVGDVVGHGIHAAATMGRLRTAVRTLADIDLPPDELLTHLDDVVIRLAAEASSDPAGYSSTITDTGASAVTDTVASGVADMGGASAVTDTAAPAAPDVEAADPVDLSSDPDAEAEGDIGATCLYAVYDPVSRRCTFARAGHVLPAVMTPDGAVDILDLPPGPPLGLGGLPFEAAEFELPEGSLIALYTDGLIEAHDHDVEAGLTLLRKALTQSAPSLEATCDTVLKALLPARPDDDVALLVARTHALGARQVVTWDLDADPIAVSEARARVSRQLSTWGLEDLDFTTELVVSELVTNAIRYGRPPIRLRLIHDRALICEVSDASGTTPHLRRARLLDEGGRGLLLVAQLAERWGTRHARHGKTVWAELNESAGFPALAAV